MRKIICFHLYNDYSGSPRVLKTILEGLLNKGFSVMLVSSKGGVLDELTDFEHFSKLDYVYKFSDNKVLTMFRYLCIQIYTFFISFRYVLTDCTFYINTLLPIGPAIAGRLMGKAVIYHYHEDAYTKGKLYVLLCWLMQLLASKIICVSEYQKSFLRRRDNVVVIPNALSEDFLKKIKPSPKDSFIYKKLLMLGSLKGYKGINEFIELAKLLPQFSFDLVLNDTINNINIYMNRFQIKKPDNLTIYPFQSDVTPFYNRSSLVLNLSDKRKFVETFGMTVLEAYSAALPVIAPTVGGVSELVIDGYNGYKIDVQDLDVIKERINIILTDPDLYMKLSNNALVFSKLYGKDRVIESVLDFFDNLK